MSRTGMAYAPDHGGDVEGYARAFGCGPVLDFSANVSPLGVPEGVRAAIAAQLDHVDRYPDPDCRELGEKIAAHEGVPPSCVLVANGCSDAIWRLSAALGGSRAVVAEPTFSEYERALSANGCAVERVAPARLLDAASPGVGVVFLCQPNNPTGELMPRTDVERLLARCEAVGARLVVDECFVGFTDDPGAVEVAGAVPGHPGLVILKAFTKLWGMAGIRLGYALCSDGGLLARMRAAGAPWSVSGPAQAAGLAALDEHGYVERVRDLVLRERPWLQGALGRLSIEARGSANFLFFELDDGGRLGRELLLRGAMIRDCSNFAGLGPGSYRIAVRTHEENVRLVQMIEEAL